MRLQLARTQGELEAARAQLAGLIAAEEQWRVELEAAKEDAVSSQTSLVHLQNQYQDRLQLKNGHIARLEYEMAAADRRRRQAEREREAVIAVLGRRARKHLQERPEGEPLCRAVGKAGSSNVAYSVIGLLVTISDVIRKPDRAKNRSMGSWPPTIPGRGSMSTLSTTRNRAPLSPSRAGMRPSLGACERAVDPGLASSS
jgi:hypothetical protein